MLLNNTAIFAIERGETGSRLTKYEEICIKNYETVIDFVAGPREYFAF